MHLRGDSSPNTFSIGAQVEAWAGDQYWFREHFLQRGYQSSVEPGIFIGTGEVSVIDSLRIRWPDGAVSRLQGIELPANLELSRSEAEMPREVITFQEPSFLPGDGDASQLIEGTSPLLTDITDRVNLDWSHERYDYNDFNRELLLLHMRSTEGPALCKADVNGDGLEDFYIGGGRDQSGILVMQNETASFTAVSFPDFEDDRAAEDTDCAFIDATGNGYPDLYVTSGGNSYSTGSTGLLDRLYINNEAGSFQESPSFLPTGGYASNSTVTPIDFNNDGSMDLFVGERLKLFNVGQPARGFLLENDGEGNFTDITSDYAPEFESLGMITDSGITDWDSDGLDDLIITGEWMSPMVFRNTGTGFENITEDLSLGSLRGLWMSLHIDDLDGDGRDDLLLGNLGLNNHFRTGADNPLRMWVGDFQNNGMSDQILSRSIEGRDVPYVLKHDLFSQIPSLQSRYPTYESYASQSMSDLFTEEQLQAARMLQADLLESIIIFNRESGPEWTVLPPRAQFSAVYGLLSEDLNGDRTPDILISQNLIQAKPMAGPYDAGYGSVLRFDESNQLKSLPPQLSGLNIPGSGRGILSVQNAAGEKIIVVAINDDRPLFFRVNR